MGKVDIEMISTIQLLGYKTLLESVINGMMDSGRQTFENQKADGINKEDCDLVIKRLQEHVDDYADAINKVDVELGGRLKRDFKTKKSPVEIGKMIRGFKVKYPVLKESVEMLMAKKEIAEKKAQEIAKNKATDTKEVAKQGAEKMSNNGQLKIVKKETKKDETK